SYGEGELDRGVREVTARPRETSDLFGEAGGVGERTGSNRDAGAGGGDGFLDPPVRGGLALAGVGRPAAQFLRSGHIPADAGEHSADREGERVARVLSGAGQLQGRFAGQHQWVSAPHLDRREASQDPQRDADVAGADRPRPRCEQVVLLGTEPDRPEHLLPGVVAMVAHLYEEVRVVAGVAGPPPFGLPRLVEV